MNSLSHNEQLVCRSKQKRAMDAKDGRIVRNVLILQDVYSAILDVVVRDLRNRCGTCDATDEKQRCQDHARLNRDREISEHGEGKRNQPHTDVGLGEFEQLRNLSPLAHVVSDDHQNSSEHGKWNKASQRCCKQQH